MNPKHATPKNIAMNPKYLKQMNISVHLKYQRQKIVPMQSENPNRKATQTAKAHRKLLSILSETWTRLLDQDDLNLRVRHLNPSRRPRMDP